MKTPKEIHLEFMNSALLGVFVAIALGSNINGKNKGISEEDIARYACECADAALDEYLRRWVE